MEGIIILKKADFSANNIGSITIMSERTKKLLSKMTQYGEDSSEATHLNNYIAALETNGFIGNNGLIKHLFIPALAGNDNELLMDIATLDEGGYPTDKRSEELKAATTKTVVSWQKGGKTIGLRCLYPTSGMTATEYRNQSTIVVDLFKNVGDVYDSFTMFTFGNILSSNNNDKYLSNLSNNSIVYLGAKNATVEGLGTSNKASVNFTKTSEVGYIAISYKPTEGISANAAGCAISDVTATGDLTKISINANADKFLLGSAVYAESRNLASHVFGFSDYMTAAQTSNFIQLTKDFLGNIGINI